MNGFKRCLLTSLALIAAITDAPVDGEEPSLPLHAAEVDIDIDDDGSLDSLLDLSLEELSQTRVFAPALQQVVTTVSRQESTIGKSPAAVFVVTQDMIRRSGARTLPEVLRIVPGLQVARIDANKWAVSIRGQNNRFANKLLVQIDGRMLYTPLFGGTYWDAQDVMLADIERIEVIRGPGATAWGANAVNGVINILTKHSRDTTGALVTAGGGKEERAFATGRVGGHATENLHWRAYGKYDDHDSGFTGVTSTVPGFAPPAGMVSDDWRQGRGGFRTDWTPTDFDEVTFQGDFYNGTAGSRQLLPAPGPLPAPTILLSDFDDRINGQNGLLRWRHKLSDESDFVLRTFYDRTNRLTATSREVRETFDIDLQHSMPLATHHRLIWGVGYQTSHDKLEQDGFVLSSVPAARGVEVLSFFVQDEIELIQDELFFTVGSKFDENDFTGFEFQPSARVVWTPNEREAVWGAVSRAIRRPTRVNDDLAIRVLDPMGSPFGVHPMLIGNTAYVSEDLLAFELGYRAQPTESFSYDVAAFYNDYNDINSVDVLAIFPPLLRFGNAQNAQVYGIELTGNYQFSDQWRVYANYSFLQVNLVTPDGMLARGEHVDPHHQAYLWLSGDLRHDVELDVMLRYVDAINVSGIAIPSYVELDVRTGWRATDNLELAVVGRNLLDSHHPEFIGEPFSGDIGTEVERSVYGLATWTY